MVAKVYKVLYMWYRPVASLGSLCTGCMLSIITQDGYINHKTNKTLQAYSILGLHYVVNSAAGALLDSVCHTRSCCKGGDTT